MNKLTGTEMAEQFSDFVNMSTHSKEEFAFTVTNEHRFLQQEMFNSMMKCIEKWSISYDNGSFDARNEYATKASKAMIQGLKDANMW